MYQHPPTDQNEIKNNDGYMTRGVVSQLTDHNDICEVCDTGGDLLCCDFCNLVSRSVDHDSDSVSTLSLCPVV